MRRAFGMLVVAIAVAAPAASAKQDDPSWGAKQIAAVTAAGLMGGDAATFRPDDPLTGAELEALLADLTGDEPLGTDLPVTLAELDKALVGALHLQDAAYRFFRAARAAGLDPPRRLGNEVVARLLGLRINHPAASDDLELRASDPVTRAETAFSVARILALPAGATAQVRDLSISFAVPALTPWQQRVLRIAVAKIGFPYVWGGTVNGFDCSGFTWAVYKLHAYPGGEQLASVLKGRTSYQMSGEVKPALRVALADVQPADVIFFGARGPESKPSQVNHMGIYIGDGWFIHSSGYGVALARIEGWYLDRFAWARRPLVEAGLESDGGF